MIRQNKTEAVLKLFSTLNEAEAIWVKMSSELAESVRDLAREFSLTDEDMATGLDIAVQDVKQYKQAAVEYDVKFVAKLTAYRTRLILKNRETTLLKQAEEMLKFANPEPIKPIVQDPQELKVVNEHGQTLVYRKDPAIQQEVQSYKEVTLSQPAKTLVREQEKENGYVRPIPVPGNYRKAKLLEMLTNRKKKYGKTFSQRYQLALLNTKNIFAWGRDWFRTSDVKAAIVSRHDAKKPLEEAAPSTKSASAAAATTSSKPKATTSPVTYNKDGSQRKSWTKRNKEYWKKRSEIPVGQPVYTSSDQGKGNGEHQGKSNGQSEKQEASAPSDESGSKATGPFARGRTKNIKKGVFKRGGPRHGVLYEQLLQRATS